MAGSKKAEISIKVNAKDLNRMFGTFNKQLKAAEKNTQRLNASTKKASTSLNNMGKKGADAGKKIKKGADKGSKGLGGMMVSLLRTRAGFVVLGLIAKQAFDIIIGKALRAHRESKKLGGTVDRLAAEIRTITGERGSRLPLIGQLMELSNQFGQTFESMAKAKYDIVSGGFLDAADSAHILEISAKAAVAGVSDVGTTAKVLVQSLRAYGKSAEEAEEFADTLFKTIKLGITTMPELAGSIGRVTPIAKVAGLSFDELGAAMSILTAKGLKTTEAATSLRALLKALISPSSDTGKALADLGVTMDAGFTQAMIRLGEAGSEGEAVLAKLFNNIRAQMGVFTLASDGASLLVKTMEEFGNKKGSMQSAFDEVASTIDQFNKKQEQTIKNFQIMKGLGAGSGAEKSFEIVEKGLGGLSARAFAAELVLANLNSTIEASATVLAEKAKVAITTGAAMALLEKKYAGAAAGFVRGQDRIELGSEAQSKALKEYNRLMAEGVKLFNQLKRLSDRKTEPILDEAVMKRMTDRIADFNAEWVGSEKPVKEYTAAFNTLIADMKKSASIELDPSFGFDLSDLAGQTTLFDNDMDEFMAIVASGATLPSDELQKQLIQWFTDANNEKTITAAKALGIDMKRAVWKDGVLDEGGIEPSELSGQMVAMVNKSVAEFEKNVKGVEPGVTLTKIVGLAKDGDWDDVKAQLADMAQSVADAKQENKEAANLVRLGEQADAVRDKFNLLAGSDWFVKTPEVDIPKLRAQMEQYALSVGATNMQLDDLYTAMVQGSGEPAEALAYLAELQLRLQKETKKTTNDMEKLGKDAANSIGNNMGNAMADIVTGAATMQEAFSQMGKAIVADLTRVIVKMLVIRAIMAIFTGGAGAGAGAGAGGSGMSLVGGQSVGLMAKGGSLPKAAAGMMIPSTGQAGLDSVPILGMPGEGVIRRNTMQRLERFLSSSESSSAMGIQPIGGGSPMMVNFNIARPQSATDSVQMAQTVSRMAREYNRRVM